MSVLPSASQSPVTGRSSSRAELGPQVAFVPLAVAVEVEEPLAVDEHADVGHAVAVEVAGDRHRLGVAEHFLAEHDHLVAVDAWRASSVRLSSGTFCQPATSICADVSWNCTSSGVMLRGQPAFTTLKCHV